PDAAPGGPAGTAAPAWPPVTPTGLPLLRPRPPGWVTRGAGAREERAPPVRGAALRRPRARAAPAPRGRCTAHRPGPPGACRPARRRPPWVPLHSAPATRSREGDLRQDRKVVAAAADDVGGQAWSSRAGRGRARMTRAR